MVIGDLPHPDVVVGDEDDSEVFTLWGFVFNQPQDCTDATCDADDLGPTPAQGAVFHIDATIASTMTIEFEGGVTFGEAAPNGVVLSNPMGAEVHVAIAPHGKALTGQDLQGQLNLAIGNTTLWWAGAFPPP